MRTLLAAALLVLSACGHEGGVALPDGGEDLCYPHPDGPCASWDTNYDCGWQCTCVPDLEHQWRPQIWSSNQVCFRR